MNLLWNLASCLLFVTVVSGKRYCRTDSDCSDLGNLVCVGNMCPLGICGCPRGEVARYLGSIENFGCVPLAKIGERCSTDEEKGVCGAANSVCKDGRCECKNNTIYESRWGGENCLEIKDVYNSESCSEGIGSVISNSGATCKGADWGYDYTGENIKDLPSHPLDGVANVAACATGEQTMLPNAYDSAPFMGGKSPTCSKLKVGDVCLLNEDCKHIQEPNGSGGWRVNGAECSYHLCKCKDSTLKPDISGLYCGKPLNHGAVCGTKNTANDSRTGVCDGSKFLRCGDPCDIDLLNTDANSRTLTCVCDPSYSTTSTNCHARKQGDHCYGDYNCKSLALNSICVDGKCAFPKYDTVNGGKRNMLGAMAGTLVILLSYSLL